MKNNKFQSNVEATRKQIEIVEATKVAKEIKQYGGIDVYNLMKAGQMYAIVVDGIVIGGAVNKADAEAAIEFQTHFTGDSPLCAGNLLGVGMRSMRALKQANDLIEAEEGGIKITGTYAIDGGEYVVDDTNELYTLDGKHICNVADAIEAKKSGALSDELFVEILRGRIKSAMAEESRNDDGYDDDEDEEYDDWCDRYFDDEDDE